EERARTLPGLAHARRGSAVDAECGRGDPRATRPLQHHARRVGDADALRRDGRLPDQCLELVDVLRHASADVRVELREAGHARRLSLGRNGRRSGLALAELAARRDRRDLDPSFLAEVLNDAIDVLEGLQALALV